MRGRSLLRGDPQIRNERLRLVRGNLRMLHDDLMLETGEPVAGPGVSSCGANVPPYSAPHCLPLCARTGVATALAVLGDTSEHDLMWACRAKQLCMQASVSPISHLLPCGCWIQPGRHETPGGVACARLPNPNARVMGPHAQAPTTDKNACLSPCRSTRRTLSTATRGRSIWHADSACAQQM